MWISRYRYLQESLDLYAKIPFINIHKVQTAAKARIFLKHFPGSGNREENPDYKSALGNDTDWLLQMSQGR